MLPSRSKTPAERSPASRTEVEKAVRTRVCACSSTTAISRDHMICMWICDSAVFGRDGIGGLSIGGPGLYRRRSDARNGAVTHPQQRERVARSGGGERARV